MYAVHAGGRATKSPGRAALRRSALNIVTPARPIVVPASAALSSSGMRASAEAGTTISLLGHFPTPSGPLHIVHFVIKRRLPVDAGDRRGIGWQVMRALPRSGLDGIVVAYVTQRPVVSTMRKRA